MRTLKVHGNFVLEDNAKALEKIKKILDAWFEVEFKEPKPEYCERVLVDYPSEYTIVSKKDNQITINFALIYDGDLEWNDMDDLKEEVSKIEELLYGNIFFYEDREEGMIYDRDDEDQERETISDGEDEDRDGEDN